MIKVTIERKGSNKKVMTLLDNGFSHPGIYDHVNTSLNNSANGYGVPMEVWTKQDGKQENTYVNFEDLEREN